MHIRRYEDVLAVIRAIDPFLDADDAKARKRRRIVEAATSLLIRHGYRKTSIDDVAAEAAIAKGTVYLYFKNKSELMVAAILAEKVRYLERVRPLFEAGISGRERLRRWIVIAVELSAEMPLTSRLLGGDRELLAAMSEIDPKTMRESELRTIDLVSDFIAEAVGLPQANEAIRDRARVFSGLMLSTALAGDKARYGLPLERFAALLADVIVDGVVPRLAKSSPKTTARAERVAAPARARASRKR